MFKQWLLVACLACVGDGLRKQLGLRADSRSDGQANLSGSAQSIEHIDNPKAGFPILLTVCGLACVVAPRPNGLAYNSSIYSMRKPGGAIPGPRVEMKYHKYQKARRVLPECGGPAVHVAISVDWEGMDLHEDNLPFFNDLREAHPEVPLTHFLNAAYFIKSGVKSIHEWSAYEAFGAADEIGLCINGLRSVVEFAGVQYRSRPNIMSGLENKPDVEGSHFQEEAASIHSVPDSPKSERALESEADLAVEFELRRHEGFDIDIRAYSVDELQAIVSKSKRILEKVGLKVGKSFRAGAWLAGPNVLEAFRREGFRVNSSAVGFDQLLDKLPPERKLAWKDAPLVAMLRDLWPGISDESQPFFLETPAGWVLEMPSTLGSIDWAAVGDIDAIVDHIGSAVEQLDAEDRFVHLAIPQETSALAGPGVIAAITEIKRKYGHRVVFDTLQTSARCARYTQLVKEQEANIKPHTAQDL